MSKSTAPSLFSRMEPHYGMHFVAGIGCTYSADDFGMAALQEALGIYLNQQAQEAFEAGENFRLYLQQGECPSTAHNILVPLSPKRGVLHSKLYLL